MEAAFDQKEIAAVVERVRLKLRGQAEAPPPIPVAADTVVGDGIYPDVDAAVVVLQDALVIDAAEAVEAAAIVDEMDQMDTIEVAAELADVDFRPRTDLR